jgi:UDP-2,3-diacylglucosamine hydrolase
MPTIIKEGAIFVADAHYPHHGNALLTLLELIEKQTISPPQLFLVGDIFDLLFGYNEYIQTFSKKVILLLQKLSTTLEIYYFEGNHDFCLKEIFPHIKLYPRVKQPVLFHLGHKEIYLAHGDLYDTGFGYNLYSRILRNPITLTLLRPLEKPIINHRRRKLQKKKICGKFQNFRTKVNKIKTYYPQNRLIIEGHFHQGQIMDNYISLPSLVCQKKIAIIKDQKIEFLLLDDLKQIGTIS